MIFACRSPAFLLVCAAALLSSTRAAILQGQLPKHEANFRKFIGKFVFDYRRDVAVGRVTVNVSRRGSLLENSGGRIIFCMFDDEKKGEKGLRFVRDASWEKRSCDQMAEHASMSQVINLSEPLEQFHYNISIHEGVRPRYWFYAFIGCGAGGANGLSEPLIYKVHSENILWAKQKEFSLDHMYVLTWQVIAAALIPILAFCSVLFALPDMSSAPASIMDHPFVRMLLLSYGAAFVSCCLWITHYSIIAKTGFGYERLSFFAVLAAIIANCTMFLISILASVGWAISRSILPRKRIFLGSVAVVGGFNALLELHAETTHDLSTKLYAYQSFPGMVSLMLKVLMTCWFWFQIRGTYEQEQDSVKRRYYKVLRYGFTAWSMHVPLAVTICFFLAPYVRYKVVMAIDLLARMFGLVLFSVLHCSPLSPVSKENIFVMQEEPLTYKAPNKGAAS